MGKATFRMVAGTDGSLRLASGYRYLFSYGITTVFLLVILMAAAWEFMDWLVAPSACLVNSAQPSASSSSAPASLEASPETTALVVPTSAPAGGARRAPSLPGVSPAAPSQWPSSVSSHSSYSARVELALDSCSCP
jgi:hypothetical protein